ncbi:MAG: 4-alpha-glucanotransferase [Candidatus Omnitrophica bacterium]|nr:4-alpha-glucanotransferase [Candidatus Omnitrophota bacterium]
MTSTVPKPTKKDLNPYHLFLEKPTLKQWKQIGTQKRSGIATPLFSIYSKQSIGIGEIPDLKLLIDWCVKTQLSILQLLPMNDTGFDFRPYDAQSSFALDPMYLSISKLKEVNLKLFQNKIEALKKKFEPTRIRVNYEVKAAKLELLSEIYQTINHNKNTIFEKYIRQNEFWLKDYALFKVAKEINQGKNWESWEPRLKNHEAEAMHVLESNHAERVRFHMWLEWQLAEQFLEVKKYAEKNGVLLMGDLPLLVSRDSADVWAHQSYFKLHLAAGAPPDAFFANGQRWGMPPYEWCAIAQNGYDYLIQKLVYAENFYDLFRIDHVVGIFRLWTISLSEPLESGGLKGVFDPSSESEWEEHGKNILTAMTQHTKMLPCAEDLGVVPDCSYKVLEELGIVGMDIVRWKKNWKTDVNFTSPENYRKNSIVVFSTHDMTPLAAWWEFDAGTVDEKMFARMCGTRRISFETVKLELFDLAASSHGRLRWKPEIKDEQTFLKILGRDETEVKDFINLYRESYDEKAKFWNFLGLKGSVPFKSTPTLSEAVLKQANLTASIFSIQLLQDWLSLDERLHQNPWQFRINLPGTISQENWNIVIPFPLEEFEGLEINRKIRRINVESERGFPKS